MVADCDRFLTQLDRLGASLSHGDTYPTNLLLRPLAGGGHETVALDWALMGVEPLGTDLGQLTFGAQNALPQTGRDDVVDALFESYLDGLRDAGARIDPRFTRFGFLASAAFRVGLFQLIMLNFQIAANAAVEAGMVEPLTEEPFEVLMARQAYALVDLL
jgi:hypothetical protein